MYNISFYRKFYARQDEIIDQYSDIHERHTSGRSHDERVERHKRWTLILIKATLISNIVRDNFSFYCNNFSNNSFS
jgi:hypothetical protein